MTRVWKRAAVAAVTLVAGVLATPAVAQTAGPRQTGASTQTHQDAGPRTVADGPADSRPAPGARVAYDAEAPVGSWANPRILSEETSSTPSAAASSKCYDVGVYYCRRYDAGWGYFKLATELGSDHHEYARALGQVYNGHYEVYMDRSWNKGADWHGRLNLEINSPTWTDELFDGPPFVTRACLYNTGLRQVACGAWH
ncbi:hypothetical protein AB0M39_06950 [Streptomyces sp. NPDC051907]|uniref:hypothetical protein n=1 Tax=Streptomyces sp. NPDC051907 TaxID=3155284 RepID=UPI0034268F02